MTPGWIRAWGWRRKVALRAWLRRFIGFDYLATAVHEMEDTRRACLYMDMAVKQEQGFMIMLIPHPVRPEVRVWQLDRGMTVQEQRKFADQMELAARGRVSLVDAMAGMPPFDSLSFWSGGRRRPFKDDPDLSRRRPK